MTPLLRVVVSVQIGIFEWMAQNPDLLVLLLSILFLMMLAIYIKLFASFIYEGTTYRHYRKGRLLRESTKGGIVLRIPFLDRIEIVPPDEPSIEDIPDYLEDVE